MDERGEVQSGGAIERKLVMNKLVRSFCVYALRGVNVTAEM